jgi:hypothetical protein
MKADGNSRNDKLIKASIGPINFSSKRAINNIYEIQTPLSLLSTVDLL